MEKIAYSLNIGNWSVDSADDPKTELLALDTLVSSESPGDHGRVVLYVAPAPEPSLLEQAVGAAMDAAGSALGLGGAGGAEEAFGVDVRGQKVKLGDTMTIALSIGDRSATVLTADILLIHSALGQTTITARTAMQKLARSRLNQVYQNQSMKQIVQDICSQVGVTAGDIETGSTYPYLVLHESRNVLATLRELALRDGMDLYVAPDNTLTLKAWAKTGPDHTLYYGIDVLDVTLSHLQPSSEQVRMIGESPASNQGSDTWHWLAKDITPFRGTVGQGVQTLALQDGAVRTKDAADTAAASRLGAITDQSARGRLKLLGRPTLTLGDAVELKNVPKAELNGLFKVTSVRHVYTKRDGFITYVGFSGQGGAAKAGDLLGQLGGALAGAAGALGL